MQQAADELIEWSENNRMNINQWRSQGEAPPEIGFTRKFLAAPLS